MKYKAVIETDDIEDFEFFEDGNGKYIRGIDANSENGEWVILYFTECDQCDEDNKDGTREARVDELEKLKAEIIEYRSKHNCGVVECLDFIDKYISELKGETTTSKGVLEQIAEDQKTLLDTTKAWSKALEHGDIY